MRLLYITNQICGSGGLERVLSIKASSLAEHYGYDVHILTLNQGNSPLFYNFSDKLKYHDIQVNGRSINGFIQYFKKIRKTVGIIKPDVIAVCDDGLKAFFLPLLLSKPCPMVYERHVSKNIVLKSEKPSLRQRLIANFTFSLMNFGGKQYDKFVVLTNGNLNEWDLINTMVIPNPLSFYPSKFSDNKSKTVLAVGRHSFQKGYDRLIKSWEIVNKSYPDWKLEIYGKIDSKQTYIKMAEEMGLSQTIHFYKPVKNIQEKYNEASIYVMSSRFEGFGMVLIEAMAYGLPCVTYNCPYGPGELVSHKEDGLVVDNGNINEFADCIIHLIKESKVRSMMGIKAREKAKLFMPNTIVKKWDDLFKHLTNDK